MGPFEQLAPGSMHAGPDPGTLKPDLGLAAWITDWLGGCCCGCCLGLQMFFQAKYLIPDPIANDVKYQASAQPFLVFGLLTTALAIGHVNHMA
jgi:chlorophyll synthase